MLLSHACLCRTQPWCPPGRPEAPAPGGTTSYSKGPGASKRVCQWLSPGCGFYSALWVLPGIWTCGQCCHGQGQGRVNDSAGKEWVTCAAHQKKRGRGTRTDCFCSFLTWLALAGHCSTWALVQLCISHPRPLPLLGFYQFVRVSHWGPCWSFIYSISLSFAKYLLIANFALGFPVRELRSWASYLTLLFMSPQI